ncbi:uncharacterized protein LOC132631038 [Lycium barbarum]|uniref:uncharacterized protein LOC132631038 n=1 Tax=Lycium barbarum TaxID=112863 RepID=UPI00293E1912|nr:uncharacterized protein LOC132631038 [Lycium barbarum]
MRNLHDLVSQNIAEEFKQPSGKIDDNVIKDVISQDKVDVEVIFDTVQQVSLKLVFLDLNKTFVITLVYTKCDESERLQLWEDIYNIAGSRNSPWLVGRDFNVVLHEDEKIGGIHVQPQDYEDFAYCGNSYELLETGFKGSHFTWWNGRGGVDCIFERLDRIFFNQQFQQWFADIEIEHLARTGSDHAHVPISLKEQGQHLKGILSAWSKEVYGDIFKQLMIKEEIVRLKEELFETDPSPMNRMVLQQAHAELKKYLHFEEEFWKQKANVTWFAEGDRNTRLFHNLVIGRRKILVKIIQNANGDWLEEASNTAREAESFFKK